MVAIILAGFVLATFPAMIRPPDRRSVLSVEVATPESASAKQESIPFWQDLSDRALYVALRVVSAALQCFPVNANLQTAKLIGSIIYLVDKRHRDRALANLRRSFPQFSERQCRRLA